MPLLQQRTVSKFKTRPDAQRKRTGRKALPKRIAAGGFRGPPWLLPDQLWERQLRSDRVKPACEWRSRPRTRQPGVTLIRPLYRVPGRTLASKIRVLWAFPRYCPSRAREMRPLGLRPLFEGRRNWCTVQSWAVSGTCRLFLWVERQREAYGGQSHSKVRSGTVLPLPSHYGK